MSNQAMSRYNAYFNYQNEFEHTKWIEKIPYISFPSEWQVQVIPPFGGAIVRFRIKHPNENYVSVYLDGYDLLGIYYTEENGFEPYWEICPYEDDVYRCKMNDTNELLEAIKYSLEVGKKR